MTSLLSSLVNNLSEGVHRIKYKFGNDEKNVTCGIKYKYCYCFLEYINFKDDLNFLTTTIISLFYCCEKVFNVMNIWMIGKNSIKRHYLKKKVL